MSAFIPTPVRRRQTRAILPTLFLVSSASCASMPAAETRGPCDVSVERTEVEGSVATRRVLTRPTPTVCVVDPGGQSTGGSEREVVCHLLRDAAPILDFTADGTGAWAVLLTAAADDGPSSYAGIAVLTGTHEAAIGIADDIPAITTLGVLTSFVDEGWDLPGNDRGSAAGGDEWGLVLGYRGGRANSRTAPTGCPATRGRTASR